MLPAAVDCYRILESRDSRYDGWFYVGVTSTRIFCRPSCPARTPKRANVRFLPSAAAAQRAGFRACLRCRPDAAPGSPEWNQRADVAARAMRLIADGVVDREGVPGLARQLAFSERHLNRLLRAELGAGPAALARMQRAQTARSLIESSDLRFAELAYAAGFASVRQFNDTIAAVFGRTPTELRRAARRAGLPLAAPGTISLRLPLRPPFAGEALLEFFRARAVPGLEQVVDGTYRRSLRLHHGSALIALRPTPSEVHCTLRLDDLRDLAVAVERARLLFDLDAAPHAVDETLAADPLLRPLVERCPGRRLPGAADGAELAIRAVLGQQVSVEAARTLTARLVARYGERLAQPEGEVTHLFPDARALASPQFALGMPVARQTAIRELARRVAAGEIVIGPGADRGRTRAALLEIPGVGPWTVEYIAMRGMADSDAFPASDLGVRHALAAAGEPTSVRHAQRRGDAWRPWRAYAVQHLWASLAGPKAYSSSSSQTENGAR